MCQFLENIKRSGFILLFAGVAVLLFTFIQAFQLLMGFEDILGSSDLVNFFGEALAPLISYAIQALYLGVMGWIGSILTRRGVQILTTTPQIIQSNGNDIRLENTDKTQPQTKRRKTSIKPLNKPQET
jgi:hypothetical protein